PALPRRVPALEQGAHRGSQRAVAELAAELKAKRQQPLLRARQTLLLLLARQRAAEVELVEAPHGRSIAVRAPLAVPRFACMSSGNFSRDATRNGRPSLTSRLWRRYSSRR